MSATLPAPQHIDRDRVAALPIDRIAEPGVVGIELNELLHTPGVDRFLEIGRFGHGPGIVALAGDSFGRIRKP